MSIKTDIKTFWAAEVQRVDGAIDYVGGGGRLTSTPCFFRSVKTLQHYLKPQRWQLSRRYSAVKHGAATTIIKMLVYGSLHPNSNIIPITLAEFMEITAASAKPISYGAYCTYRLRKADGGWAQTKACAGKYGKTWNTAGALRRHLGDRIRHLQSGSYTGSMVHITVYDAQGINVLSTVQVPVLDFFLQSPIYSKKWAEINTPTTLSAGRLTGRFASSDIV